METVTITFYILSAVLLIGAVTNILKLSNGGVYPPKRVLKRRAQILALGGIFLLFLGLIFSLFK